MTVGVCVYMEAPCYSENRGYCWILSVVVPLQPDSSLHCNMPLCTDVRGHRAVIRWMISCHQIVEMIDLLVNGERRYTEYSIPVHEQ